MYPNTAVIFVVQAFRPGWCLKCPSYECWLYNVCCMLVELKLCCTERYASLCLNIWAGSNEDQGLNAVSHTPARWYWLKWRWENLFHFKWFRSAIVDAITLMGWRNNSVKCETYPFFFPLTPTISNYSDCDLLSYIRFFISFAFELQANTDFFLKVKEIYHNQNLVCGYSFNEPLAIQRTLEEPFWVKEISVEPFLNLCRILQDSALVKILTLHWLG